MNLFSLFLGVAVAATRPISPILEGNAQSPAWSPSGGSLTYEVNFHEKKAINLYVYTPGEGQSRKVQPIERGTSSLTAGFAQGGTERVVHEASWAPAPFTVFVYTASTSSKDLDIFLDGSGALAPTQGADGGAAWSPDGRWIVFTSARTGQGDLYLLDTDALEAAPRQLTRDPDSAELFASWSPDSRSLLFVGHTNHGDNIYLLSELGNPKMQPLTSWSRTQTRPTFSPDGKLVAFYANKEELDRYDLYVVSPGALPRKLIDDVVMNMRGPAWTPDGTALVVVRNDDDAFDPVWMVPVTQATSARALDTGTVGNGDLDVTRGTDGRVWLAVAAQGLTTDQSREFKRIYVLPLTP